MCLKPNVFKRNVVGCKKCLPCQLNTKRQWTIRLLFEAMCHDENAFVTLTYDEEHLPSDGYLEVSELQGYIKRVRKNIEPRKIRYYGVGEYGKRGGRPHYHVAMFGLSDVGVLNEAWGKGTVDVGFLEPASAAYICGYVVKKYAGIRRNDKAPEFARMSLKPGIGADYADAIAAGCFTKGGSGFMAREGDVPRVIRYMGKRWPLADYLRRRVRLEMGISEANADIVAWRRYERQLEAALEAGGVGKASEKVWARRIISADRARFIQSQVNLRKEL